MEDERFRNPWDRKAREEELAALLEETFSTQDTAHWLQMLDDAGVVAGPIYNMEQVYRDPQVLAREMLVDTHDPELGTIHNIGVPVKLSATPGRIRRRAPALGEHSAEVLLERGFSQDEVDTLLAEGVILGNQGSGSLDGGRRIGDRQGDSGKMYGMRDGGTRPLLFLVTCLGFAETTLGMLATFAGTDGTLAAVFALVSLGLVLLALVAMYFRDPAFLTFSSEQALDVRVLELLRDKLTPELLSQYAISLKARTGSGRMNLARNEWEQRASEIEEFLMD